jgi:anti-sigma regulatory factor (Ser/Thr protein kinase)
VAHAYSGTISVSLDADTISMRLADSGPGIADIAQAMQKGFSTASPEVREMGFGAGMGLPNISANADRFVITSEPGTGTTLEILINLNSAAV